MKKPMLGIAAMVVVLGAAACSVADSVDTTDSQTSELKAKHCGGNVAHPKSCSTGYTCIANPKNPDLPGTCQKACVQKIMCMLGSHFDSAQCKCVADCIQKVACLADEHFDTTTCACEANCVDTVLCVQGKHWDSTACACVAN